jgi:hypothetical protein
MAGELNGTAVLIRAEVPVGSGTFVTVGSQRDATIEESNDFIDESSKLSRNQVGEAGRYTSRVTCEHLLVPGASELVALRDAVRAGSKLKIRRQENGTDVEEATCVPTTRNISFPDQAPAVVSMTFQVSGGWTLV